MKRIILAIALVITIGFSAGAQTDGFFGDDGGYSGGRTESNEMPINPSGVVGKINEPQNAGNAPLGEGLVVLTALGVGYAISRKREK